MNLARHLSSPWIGTLLATTLFQIIVGCGPAGKRSHQAVIINNNDPAENLEEENRQTAQAIAEFVLLYSADGSLSKEETYNIFEKLRQKLPALAGKETVSSTELVDLLFSLDHLSSSNGDDKLTLKESLAGIKKLFPLARWVAPRESIPVSKLEERIELDFPSADKTSVHALSQSLSLYDERKNGGNANNLMERTDLDQAGLALALVSASEFPKDLPTQRTTDQLLAIELKRMFSKFLFPRHGSTSLDELAPQTFKVEQMLFGTELVALLKEAQPRFSARRRLFGIGLVPENSLETHRIVKLYDSRAVGGNEDRSLNALELFHLKTDYRLVQNLQEMNNGAETLSSVFPSLDNDVRAQFVKQAKSSQNSVSQVLQELVLLGLTDTVFQIYDVDHNRMLSQEEASLWFQELNLELNTGILEHTLIDFIFSDIDRPRKNPNAAPELIDRMRAWVTGESLQKKEISQDDFLRRLRIIL